MPITRSHLTTIVVAALLAIAVPSYGIYSMRSHFEERIGALERQLQSVHEQDAAKAQKVADDLNDVAQNLDDTRKLSADLKREHTRTAQTLSTQLKSNSAAVDQLRQDSVSKLEAVQQDASTKIGAVSGEVQTVKADLNSTKDALASSRQEIGDIGRQIARNSTELSELRRLGEHDYFEFDVKKSPKLERIANVQVQLKKTDPKKQKYDVVLLVDDNKFEKRDRVANEPIEFLVGRNRQRYELVVNYVDKDRIRGYVSTPKDQGAAGDAPTLRPQK